MNWVIRCALKAKTSNPRPPRRLPPFLLAFLRKCAGKKRETFVVLSLCQVYRLIRLKPEVSVESIVQPYQGAWLALPGELSSLKSASQAFCKEFSIKPLAECDLG